MSDKATRAEITIGPHLVEGFMLPDGGYRMSLTQAAAAIGLTVRNASDFLQSNAFKSLQGEGYSAPISEINLSDQGRGSARIRALPLEVVGTYWVWQAYRGNKLALALCVALMVEGLERRFDAAFEVERSEEERNQRLSDRLSSRDLEAIGMLLAEDDDLRREVEDLRQRLIKLGEDPYQLPGNEV